MSKIISIHSFRGGTGKSNTTANLAVALALTGKRVGIVDTDILSPGIHVLFGLAEENIGRSLNDYLWGKCKIEQVAQDMSLRLEANVEGKVFLIPSSMKASDIARVLREGYDVGLLNDGYQHLIDILGLDALMLDTHPGLNEETLLSIAISDGLAILLRPDSQDYQGTGVAVDVARKLDVPRMWLIVNKVPPEFDIAAVKARVERAYDCEVVGVLPHCDEMMALGSSGLFMLQYPDHPITATLKQIAARLIA